MPDDRCALAQTNRPKVDQKGDQKETKRGRFSWLFKRGRFSWLFSRYINNDWRELLSDRSNIEQLTKIYDFYIGRRRRNSHSLLLRHEPKQSGRCDKNATVLLGDLELDGKACEVLHKRRFIDSKAGVILIPHHGADSYDLMWLDEKARTCGCCASFVVSYGTKNTYGHPCFIYDGTITELRNCVSLVNEKKYTEYNYQIRVW